MRKTYIVLIAIGAVLIGGIMFGIAFTVSIPSPFNRILLFLSVAMMWIGLATVVLVPLIALIKRIFK